MKKRHKKDFGFTKAMKALTEDINQNDETLSVARAVYKKVDTLLQQAGVLHGARDEWAAGRITDDQMVDYFHLAGFPQATRATFNVWLGNHDRPLERWQVDALFLEMTFAGMIHIVEENLTEEERQRIERQRIIQIH
jgi:hypothetical protein